MKGSHTPVQLFRSGIGIVPNQGFGFKVRIRSGLGRGFRSCLEVKNPFGEIQVEGILLKEGFQEPQCGAHLTPVQKNLGQAAEGGDVPGIELEGGPEPGFSILQLPPIHAQPGSHDVAREEVRVPPEPLPQKPVGLSKIPRLPKSVSQGDEA